MRRIGLFQLFILIACLILFASSNVKAQGYCDGNFDYDQDVDGSDAATFKSDFGRSLFKNPCPPDGPAPVAKTEQTTSYGTGDNGDLETGVALPNSRFTDNADGTVTDNLTGLIWLKNANCLGLSTWTNALFHSNGLESGECGLTDGSHAGEWRLPQIKELQSLVDYSNYGPALPPFINVQAAYYWSSTTNAQSSEHAWYVYMGFGVVNSDGKSNYNYLWPVKGGR